MNKESVLLKRWVCGRPGPSLGTCGGLVEDDLLGLGQHDEAQGAHGLRGDVRGGLPVERRQNRVLDVAKGAAGQLHRVEKAPTVTV